MKGRIIDRTRLKEIKQQKEEKRQAFMLRKKIGLVAPRKVTALHREWVLEETQSIEKRKKKASKSPKVREQWVNEQGNIWMMSTNLREGMLDKIAHLSMWISKQPTMPSVIALQETWLLKSERQKKTIQMVVNKSLPEYRF